MAFDGTTKRTSRIDSRKKPHLIQDVRVSKAWEVDTGQVWIEINGMVSARLATSEGPIHIQDATLTSTLWSKSAYPNSPSDLEAEVSPHVSTPLATKSIRSLVADPNTNLDERVELLSRLLVEDEIEAASYIVEEFSREATPSDWMQHLVCATEHLQFLDRTQAAVVKDRLLAWANEVVNNRLFAPEGVLWSAIRRSAAMLPEAEVGLLLPFLGAKASLGTRQVAAQSLQAIFADVPPSDLATVGPLATRLAELCSKYIDADIMVAPEVAAFALNALIALVLVCDPAAVHYAVRLKKDGGDWLADRAAQFLSASKSKRHYASDSTKLIDACLSKLTCCD